MRTQEEQVVHPYYNSGDDTNSTISTRNQVSRSKQPVIGKNYDPALLPVESASYILSHSGPHSANNINRK